MNGLRSLLSVAIPHSRGRASAVVAIAAVALVAVGGTALAGHIGSGVKSYTGCLTNGEGVIIKVKEGNAPGSPCTGNQVQVHFSSGDITAITGGTGLTPGGDNGAVTLAVAPTYRLPQGCTSGYVAKWDGDSWECAADQGKEYTAGTGLDLTGTEFSVNSNFRLPQDATDGDSVIYNVPGGWQTAKFAFAGETCPSGEFARATSEAGQLVCAAPSSGGSGGGTAYLAVERNPADGSEDIGILNNGNDFEMVRLELPPGAYVLLASGLVYGDFFTPKEVFAGCTLSAAGTVLQEAGASNAAGDEGAADESVAFTTATSLAGGGTVKVECGASSAGVTGSNFRLVAIPVGAIG